MINVEEVIIEDFRGIRKLILKFNGKNFAVCGPNGTGKSGVVDALEFGLTGNISRLSGSGTGSVSVRAHAPHVDSRDNPEKAKVTLILSIPSLGDKKVTVERSVANPYMPLITPATPDVLKIFKELENHPEFVLSRRELIAYILAQPGKRSEEIQALLRLDQIGELRGNLKTISNTCNKEFVACKKISMEIRDHLARALEIAELKTNLLLKAVNERRVLLGLDPIKTLESTTSLHDGLKTGSEKSSPSKINKMQLAVDLKNLQELITKFTTVDMIKECGDLYDQLKVLSADPAVVDSVSRETFLRTAISFIAEEACPVCGTEWDIDTLKALVEVKLKKFEDVTKTRLRLEKELEPIISRIEELNESMGILEKYIKILKPEYIVGFSTYRNNLSLRIKDIKSFLPLTKTLSSLRDINDVPKVVIDTIDSLETALAKIPEPTKLEAARDYLILCQDRLETYREASRKAKRTEAHALLAQSVYDIYTEESNKVLEEVYKQVEEEFGHFYQLINSDDESAFSAKLTPSMGKLGFDVEFYGRGHFPPGAYHSEGHQDGMGLCLYLSLMRRLQGSNFNFAVLDDVLMSVDTGHRREVCALLKKHFPNTQFVLTTHDEVWLKHMISAGLIKSTNFVRFSNWTPDQGPTEWSSRDIWTEINTALQKNDVRDAASILRNYLEYISKEICHNLRAPVEFKGDGRYELGDVLPSAVKQFRNILLKGAESAESWGRPAEATTIKDREQRVAAALQNSNADQWQINPAIHYNEWANLTSSDFGPVSQSFHDLIQNFICEEEKCGGLYYLTFVSPKEFDSLQCMCGKTNISLKKQNNKK